MGYPRQESRVKVLREPDWPYKAPSKSKSHQLIVEAR
jgi:hypothetical protein